MPDSSVSKIHRARRHRRRADRASLIQLQLALDAPEIVFARVLAKQKMLMLIAYTPWGHALFSTASIALVVWLFIIPFALGMLALEELRKWLVRVCPGHPNTILTHE